MPDRTLATVSLASPRDMQIETQSPDAVSADVVVVPVAEGGEPPANADERVRALIASGKASTAFEETTVVQEEGLRLAVAGLGRRPDADAIRTAVACAARSAKRVRGALAYVVDPALDVSVEEQSRAAADGLL